MAFRAGQQAQAIALQPPRRRSEGKRSRRESRTRSIGSACGAQGVRRKGCVGRDAQGLDPRPSGAIKDHDGVPVVGESPGEAVEEDRHGVGVDPGQDAGEGRLAAGPGSAGPPGPCVALVLHAGWASAPRRRATAEPPLPAHAPLVHEPQRHPLVAVGRGALFHAAWSPLLMRRSAASSVLGWVGRVFCREKPARPRMRERLRGGSRLPKRSAMEPQRSGSVRLLTPLRLGVGSAAETRRRQRRFRLRPCRGTARCRAVAKPGQPCGVLAHNRVAQRLAVHPGRAPHGHGRT
jgi:hypothetical protein